MRAQKSSGAVWLLKVSLASYLQTRNGLDRSENETVDLQAAEEG